MPNEVYVRRDMVVRLYDGDTKVIIRQDATCGSERIDFAQWLEEKCALCLAPLIYRSNF